MLIDEIFLEGLLEQATESDRRRVNFDMRTSVDDKSQRMLNVLLPGTQVPVHRHKETTETVVVLSGRLTEVFFNEDGSEYARYDLCPAEGRYALQVPKGVWHTVVVNEPCVIFEAKDGAYSPLSIDDTMNSELLNERTELINSLNQALKKSNIKAIISLTSSFNAERYSNDSEVMELYRLALSQISE